MEFETVYRNKDNYIICGEIDKDSTIISKLRSINEEFIEDKNKTGFLNSKQFKDENFFDNLKSDILSFVHDINPPCEDLSHIYDIERHVCKDKLADFDVHTDNDSWLNCRTLIFYTNIHESIEDGGTIFMDVNLENNPKFKYYEDDEGDGYQFMPLNENQEKVSFIMFDGDLSHMPPQVLFKERRDIFSIFLRG